MHEGAVLGAIGVPDEMWNVLDQFGGIDGIFFGEGDVRILGTLK